MMKSKLISGFRLRLQVLFYNRLKHITMSCGEGCRISGLHLSSCGKNNKIVLGDNVTLDNVTVSIFGSNNRIVIRGNNHVAGIRLAMEDDGNTIEIGKHNFIGSGSLLAALEGTRIEIGDDCMIAGHCEIRTSDSHSLLDAGGKRINCARDIILGGHIWVGVETLILKGAMIPGDCVVAARSVVCAMKDAVSGGSLLGGTPARVLRENISWNHKRIQQQ